MTQPWTVVPNDPFMVPNSAGPNDPAIIITNADLPPCMQTDYASAELFRPNNSQTGVIAADLLYYFKAQRKAPGIVQRVDHGTLLYDPIAGTCDYHVWMQYEIANFSPNARSRVRFGQIPSSGTLPYSVDSPKWIIDGGIVDYDLTSALEVGASGTAQVGYIPYAPVQQDATAIFAVPVASAVIAGTLVNVTVLRATDVFFVRGYYDTERIAAGAGTAVGQLRVDGVIQAKVAPYSDGVVGNRTTLSQEWVITGLAAGAHTFELSGVTTGAAGVWRMLIPHTNIVVDARF